MKRKILGLFVCVILIAIAVPATGVTIHRPLQSRNITTSTGREMTKLIQQIDESMIEKYVENITAFGPRIVGTAAFENAGRYIYNEFRKSGLDVRYQNWTSNVINGSNIEAILHGVDSSSDSIYIICGHYDSVPGCPGADDNAAGTAAVLAAAEVMSQYAFNHTIRFVTFSGEEKGLLGSYAYVKEAYEDKDNIVAALNIDMMGYATTEETGGKVEIFQNLASRWITDTTAQVSEQYAEYINLEIAPILYRGACSDHYRFWQFGYDALMYYEFETNMDDSIDLRFQGELDNGIYYSERLGDITDHGWDLAHPLVKYGKLFNKLNKKENELVEKGVELDVKRNSGGRYDSLERRIALLKLIGAKQVEYVDNKYVVMD